MAKKSDGKVAKKSDEKKRRKSGEKSTEKQCKIIIVAGYVCIADETGTWWGVEQMSDEDGRRYSQSAGIDVVGISTVDNTAVVGECKFKNEKIDKEIYDTLIRRSRMLSGKYNVTKYLLFSLSGYTKWFEELDVSNVAMISIDDLYK